MELNNIQLTNTYDNILKLLNNLNLQNTAQVFSTEFLVLPENQDLIKEAISEFIQDFLPNNVDNDSEIDKENDNNSNSNMNDPVSPIQNQTISNEIQILSTQTEIDERIDKFITVKRAKIDQTNANPNSENNENEPCSRTNPNKINRNIQMKIDVINNYQREISLLRSVGIEKRKSKALDDPSILERLSSLEAHLNLKLENSPNKQLSALERIQVIELKLLQLERTLPTWSGLNFNQPNREFPPPPAQNYVFSIKNGDIIISQKSKSS
ncbi:hypothetical protein CONCODRAFT_86512 [Conidiobolus coronatus NRRL 28638]|uniref:Uncharacterized protein n=1 Tax=Conidiobolus coronatus (strain ATCC 28846 / CBS 209.66 / NRRL 28638) TaxID=796925 RepID=A0A137NZN6_CONC2|nr:hypothetical protein CONCODRAFT_86512 [Conidiobolus coronatus NRRL 28638]|eukprot:KXN68300.1 hypothetical protein CONCODRAFT_86512 [Conidiobolus coronatus NRRL 28638]